MSSSVSEKFLPSSHGKDALKKCVDCQRSPYGYIVAALRPRTQSELQGGNKDTFKCCVNSCAALLPHPNKRLCRQTRDFHLQCRKTNPWDISVTVQRQQSSGLHKLTSRCPTMQKRSGSFRPQVEFTLSLCARPISRSPVAG